jgi:hypothetical protein
MPTTRPKNWRTAGVSRLVGPLTSRLTPAVRHLSRQEAQRSTEKLLRNRLQFQGRDERLIDPHLGSEELEFRLQHALRRRQEVGQHLTHLLLFLRPELRYTSRG